MKLQVSELLSSSKPETRRKPNLTPLIALTLLITILPIYFSFYHNKLSLFSDINRSYQHDHNITLVTSTNHRARWRRNTTGGGDASLHPPAESNVAALVNTSPGPARTEENTSMASSNMSDHSIMSTLNIDTKCDLFTGEWIPNPEGPYYTNMSCNAIEEHQNCMKYGRPDLGFLKWRWKPDECELPIFDPHKFLEMVRGKSLAFVGDSVARNHMQSLICLLSKVAQPLDISRNPTDENRAYKYRDYNFTLSIISSPYLIRTERTEPDDPTRPYRLFLDEADEAWTAKIPSFDYIIISAGHWFFRPTYFYLNRTLTACLYCPQSNLTHRPSSFSYRRAFRTALGAINGAGNFTGVAFVRTFAPSHFEGGAWDRGGDCARRRPFRRNETALEDYSAEMYRIQLEEVGIAQRAGRTGGRMRVFDATKAMLLRGDGHPSKYGGHRPGPNSAMPNDCVHWCLPGPIDAWNDLLQELLKREIEDQ